MIQVRDFNFTYRKSGKKVIHQMVFNISESETQRLLIGLLKNYQGHINVLGKERKNWDKDFYEQIGVAFDFPNLYTRLTAKENLQLIGAYYTNSITDTEELFEMVGLLPDKNVRVENFSKGMKMRLNFVRSIMHSPRLY